MNMLIFGVILIDIPFKVLFDVFVGLSIIFVGYNVGKLGCLLMVLTFDVKI